MFGGFERKENIRASVPVPTFVSLCSTLLYKRRNQRDTSNYMVSSVALDLTFLRTARGNAGRNVKSATLAFVILAARHVSLGDIAGKGGGIAFTRIAVAAAPHSLQTDALPSP